MKYETDADGVFHYVLGELSFTDFDKSGRISIWKLLKLIEGCRRSKNRGFVKNLQGLGVVNFMRSHYLEIYPAFYTSRLTQDHAVEMTSTVSHLGRTSHCLETDVYDLNSKTLLASMSSHAVFVSEQTRRPSPVVSIAYQQTKVMPRRGQRPVSGPDFPARPTSASCFAHTATVMPSDTDNNEHLNQAMFVRFCFDCASLAALNGYLPSFREDVIYADVKTLWILYKHEARVSQKLSLYCWEDDTLSCTLWVEMCAGSKVIGQCQIQFYEEGLTRPTIKTNSGQTLAKL